MCMLFHNFKYATFNATVCIILLIKDILNVFKKRSSDIGFFQIYSKPSFSFCAFLYFHSLALSRAIFTFEIAVRKTSADVFPNRTWIFFNQECLLRTSPLFPLIFPWIISWSKSHLLLLRKYSSFLSLRAYKFYFCVYSRQYLLIYNFYPSMTPGAYGRWYLYISTAVMCLHQFTHFISQDPLLLRTLQLEIL